MKNFSNPLFRDTLREFTRPTPGHHWQQIAWLDDCACACNGWVAIKAHRGLWTPHDFEPPTPEFVLNFASTPLDLFPAAATFYPLDFFRGAIFRRALISPFTSKGHLSATPAFRVGRVVVHLSMLQLVARLPRCEFTQADTGANALFFRCSGALGCIAGLDENTPVAYTIDGVRRAYDGRPIPTSTAGALPLPGWPPPPPID